MGLISFDSNGGEITSVLSWEGKESGLNGTLMFVIEFGSGSFDLDVLFLEGKSLFESGNSNNRLESSFDSDLTSSFLLLANISFVLSSFGSKVTRPFFALIFVPFPF